MLNRAVAVVAAVVALCCAGLGWWAASTRAENKALVATVADLQTDLAASQRLRLADQEVASRYARSVAKMTTINKATDAKLQAALRANAAWADSPVPPDVADALGMPSPTQTR